MRRTLVATIVAVALVTLAGCGAMDDGATPTAEPESDDPDEMEIQTPEPTPEPLVGADGSVDAAELRGAHERTLRDAGSFTATMSVTIERDGERASVDRETQLDLDAAEATESVTAYGTETDRYTVENRTYVRAQAGDQTVYDVAERPYEGDVQPIRPEAAMQTDAIGSLFAEVQFDEVSEERHDGVSVTVLEADGVETWEPPGYDPANVTEFEVRALVDDDGIVRSLEIRLVELDDGSEVDVEIAIELTGIGETQVEEPPWVDEIEE